MPSPIDVRKKPTDVKVHVTSRAGVDIMWADGHASHYDFAYLREQCPCAICDDLRQKDERNKNDQQQKSQALHAPAHKSPMNERQSRPHQARDEALR